MYIIISISYLNIYLNRFKKILTDCKEGSYGYECNETCGHCRNNGFCFHINGTCLTGCSAGFTGEVCKKRTYEG